LPHNALEGGPEVVTGDSSAAGRSPERAPVIFLPGIIMPAHLRYAALINALGDGREYRTKELEIYADSEPPEDYSIELEIAGITRFADASGFDRFHLYAHSAGGACALAYAAAHPERLFSLALDEPASDFSPELKALSQEEIALVRSAPGTDQMKAFASFQLRPGVEPPSPPPGPPPDWMANRRAGIEAIITAMDRFNLDIDRLRTFTQPVYYSYGSLSNQLWEVIRDHLAQIFPNFQAERYEGFHHFNTSNAAEPERVARVLHDLWHRAERGNRESSSRQP
jgi:pimeloyl-ACP methyl ester carboxylesterase